MTQVISVAPYITRAAQRLQYLFLLESNDESDHLILQRRIAANSYTIVPNLSSQVLGIWTIKQKTYI